MKGRLERRFRLAENGTMVRNELLGGVTAFMTMSYIIFVQPAVLFIVMAVSISVSGVSFARTAGPLTTPSFSAGDPGGSPALVPVKRGVDPLADAMFAVRGEDGKRGSGLPPYNPRH